MISAAEDERARPSPDTPRQGRPEEEEAFSHAASPDKVFVTPRERARCKNSSASSCFRVGLLFFFFWCMALAGGGGFLFLSAESAFHFNSSPQLLPPQLIPQSNFCHRVATTALISTNAQPDQTGNSLDFHRRPAKGPRRNTPLRLLPGCRDGAPPPRAGNSARATARRQGAEENPKRNPKAGNSQQRRGLSLSLPYAGT